MNTPDSRRATRRSMRAARRALHPSLRRAHAERLAGRLAASEVFLRFERIAVYLPNDGELSLEPFASRCWGAGKQTYLPVLDGPRLRFQPYQRDTRFTVNRFGIPEPYDVAGERLPPRFLDAVLMPLVAFDESGNRLGMGGGFFDRTFGRIVGGEQRRGPRLIGIAYEFQRVDAIAAESWDVPLDGIATERGLRRFTHY